MKPARFLFLIVLLLIAIHHIFFPFYIYADITQCAANATSPTYLGTSTSQTFTFPIENNGPDDAVWVRITRPSANFTFTAGSLSGWSAAVTDSTITFTGGTLEAGTEASFSVTMTSGASEVSAQTFTVTMNEEESESNTTTCSSSASIEITDNPPTVLDIANVAVSNVAHDSVTISFDTGAESTATIDYGTTDDYGDQVEDTSSDTSHSMNITGLTANTTYHYKITATDGDTSDETDDATFTTALSASATSTPGPTSTPIVQTTTTTRTITPTPTPDQTAPVVTLEQLPSQPYKDAPTIKGNAVDNASVSSVEYTIDNGKTWTRITSVSGLSSATATYSFSPTGLTTGQGKIKVRAKDAAGNIGTSAELVLTIDQAGPTISLATDLTHPFAKTPEISGKAVDTSGESSIEYSIDNGKNWIPVDSVTIENSTTTQFKLTPPLIDDGNYALVIRGKDSLGNISASPFSSTLIIDRLPPRVGGLMIAIGPQILNPTSSGFITLPDILHTFHISFIGGPTEAHITFKQKDSDKIITAPLHPIIGSTIWTSDASLPTAGTYTVEIYAKDGAQHEISKELTKITALPSGNITNKDGTGIKTTITIYTKDILTGSFLPWDASAYGQQNPQIVLPGGSYAFYPPSGTYYLSIERGFGQAPVVTNTFTIASGQPVSPEIVLPDLPHLQIFGFSIPLPSLLRQHIEINLAAVEKATPTSITEIPLPETIMTAIDPSRVYQDKLTHIVLLNTWDPQIASHLQQLEKLQQTDTNSIILGIFPHESAATIELFAKRGGYTTPLRADPDGELLQHLSYSAMPTTYSMTEDRVVTQQTLGIR